LILHTICSSHIYICTPYSCCRAFKFMFLISIAIPFLFPSYCYVIISCCGGYFDFNYGLLLLLLMPGSISYIHLEFNYTVTVSIPLFQLMFVLFQYDVPLRLLSYLVWLIHNRTTCCFAVAIAYAIQYYGVYYCYYAIRFMLLLLILVLSQHSFFFLNSTSSQNTSVSFNLVLNSKITKTFK